MSVTENAIRGESAIEYPHIFFPQCSIKSFGMAHNPSLPVDFYPFRYLPPPIEQEKEEIPINISRKKTKTIAHPFYFFPANEPLRNLAFPGFFWKKCKGKLRQSPCAKKQPLGFFLFSFSFPPPSTPARSLVLHAPRWGGGGKRSSSWAKVCNLIWS